MFELVKLEKFRATCKREQWQNFAHALPSLPVWGLKKYNIWPPRLHTPGYLSQKHSITALSGVPKTLQGRGQGASERREGWEESQAPPMMNNILQPVLWGFRKVVAMCQFSRSFYRVNAQRIMPLFIQCNIMQMTKDEQALLKGP